SSDQVLNALFHVFCVFPTPCYKRDERQGIRKPIHSPVQCGSVGGRALGCDAKPIEMGLNCPSRRDFGIWLFRDTSGGRTSDCPPMIKDEGNMLDVAR